MSERAKLPIPNLLRQSTNNNKAIENNFPNAILAEAIDVLGCRVCETTQGFRSDIEIRRVVE